ncbi:MAG: tetratricopeptide repeat protein [Actinomycetota bacterium]
MEVTLSQKQLRVISAVAVAFLLVIGLVVYELVGSSGSNNSAQSYAAAGISAFKAGDYSLALQEFNQELQAAQGTPGAVAVAHYNIGTTQVRMHLVSAAADNFRMATQESPRFGVAWMNLGLAESQLGNTSAALRDYEKLLQLQPTNALGLLNSGILMYKNGQKTTGLSRIQQAVVIDPALKSRVPTDIPLK